MIFILHYLLFNAGLPAIILLLTLFLQTYSDASLTEIGTLLMALPFVSILMKPIFCALADRQRAHKRYLMIALALVALGYGSLTLAPFYPAFVHAHGRLVWYLDVLAIVVGYSAFGIVWSLGDALAVNHAQMAGLPWGAYRVWGVVSWGAGGILIGQINELPCLPKYVPALFVLLVALVLEILLLAVWPNKHFIMGGSLELEAARAIDQEAQLKCSSEQQPDRRASQALPDRCEMDEHWTASRSLTGSARADPRMIGALANMFMEDLGGTLRSSLGGKPKRAGLDALLTSDLPLGTTDGGSLEFKPPAPKLRPLDLDASLAASEQAHVQATPTAGFVSNTFGRGTLRRTQMAWSRMNSLSAASGHAIADELVSSFSLSQADSTLLAAAGVPASQRPQYKRQQAMYMSSLASQASLSKATAAARTLGKESALSLNSIAGLEQTSACAAYQLPVAEKQDHLQPVDCKAPPDQVAANDHFRSLEELQLILLKLIVRGDKTIWKYLVMFTIFGALLTCHLSYFFLHLEQLCRHKGVDFSLVTGGILAAHSVSEVFSFTIAVPYFVPLIGRSGALLTCALIYAIRFAYYATYLEQFSPFTSIPFELAHGIAYGIVYSLITDIASECVNQVDLYIPQLVKRRLLDPALEANCLKLQLRATMQGLFSGAFDGLGNGIGALAGGLFLDAYPFTHLWCFCTWVCLITLLLYPLTEWRSLLRQPAHGTKS